MTDAVRHAWLKWRYVRITAAGALVVDLRWYAATGAWKRAMDALKLFPVGKPLEPR